MGRFPRLGTLLVGCGLLLGAAALSVDHVRAAPAPAQSDDRLLRYYEAMGQRMGSRLDGFLVRPEAEPSVRQLEGLPAWAAELPSAAPTSVASSAQPDEGLSVADLDRQIKVTRIQLLQLAKLYKPGISRTYFTVRDGQYARLERLLELRERAAPDGGGAR